MEIFNTKSLRKIIEIKENQPRILISRTGIQEYIFSTMSWRTIAPIGTWNSYFTCIQIPETSGKILAVGDQYSTYRIPVIFDVTNNRSVPANHQVFQRFAPTLVKTIIFKSNVFLPVEHRSYNRSEICHTPSPVTLRVVLEFAQTRVCYRLEVPPGFKAK